MLERLGLEDKRQTQFVNLSGGQRQRLSIALALVGRPQLAILDELTTGLDPGARRETWKLIEGVRDQGVTVILVTHFMEEAEYLCDRVALLHHGRVIAVNTPAGLASGAGPRLSFRPRGAVDPAALRALVVPRRTRRVRPRQRDTTAARPDRGRNSQRSAGRRGRQPVHWPMIHTTRPPEANVTSLRARHWDNARPG